MPIIGDGEVLGVFELFSGKIAAFNERDLAALDRLGKMVETAVKHAAAYQTRLEIKEFLQVEVGVQDVIAPKPEPAMASASPTGMQATGHHADSKRPLLWSAAGIAESAGRSVSDIKHENVPPMLRQLQQCQACGFPVSSGRAFCVECEDKQWRGERLAKPMAQASHPLEEHTSDGPQSKSWLGPVHLIVGAILVIVLAAAVFWLR
jgi:hypothetical protein